MKIKVNIRNKTEPVVWLILKNGDGSGDFHDTVPLKKIERKNTYYK